MTDLWTLAELAARAAVALGDTAEQASARVREIPDARTIRWYQTTGLIDRPLALRGRTALYGRRQLLQLVAIKRRQAEGSSLAEIQAELAGQSTEALESIADLPPQPSSTPQVDVIRDDKTMIRARFWTERNHGSGHVAADLEAEQAAAAAPDEAALAGPPGETIDTDEPAAAAADAASGRAAFAGHARAAIPSTSAGSAAAEPPARAPAPGNAAASSAAGQERTAAADEALPVQGLRLTDDVLLILDPPAGPIDPADVQALREAAAPLLDALVRRGLVANHTRTKEPA
jgi:DNA-binding transcriptional MerR regulator